ncbi:hypothetical protein [Psychroflexus aestuariivivens]|uniref:hypothetical protein n=1 Tax=Psychroflexus aestuariivivens TaxID=1795040 RepID=UPI001864C36B|nr:hypothetical protein [Psychroflexus aestuariivivens]
MLEELSPEMQFILIIVGLAVLFLLVFWNNKRNKSKRFDRDKRNFRKNFYEKKQKQKDP